MQKLIPRILTSFGILVVMASCSSGPNPYAQDVTNVQMRLPMRAAGPYALGANDQLRIQVYNEPTISGDYVVDGAGSLSIPVAGRVKAAGLTTEQLERRITTKLNNGILKD